jgi:hypothetical protein
MFYIEPVLHRGEDSLLCEYMEQHGETVTNRGSAEGEGTHEACREDCRASGVTEAQEPFQGGDQLYPVRRREGLVCYGPHLCLIEGVDENGDRVGRPFVQGREGLQEGKWESTRRGREMTRLWLEDDEIVLDRVAYGHLLPRFDEREDDVVVDGPGQNGGQGRVEWGEMKGTKERGRTFRKGPLEP